MSKQKYKHGDLVRVADDLGSMMEHFEKGCNAIVIGSYADQFGGGGANHQQYTIFIEGGGETSWYYEHQLNFIRHAPELLEAWKEQAEARSRDYADLAWIREHWLEQRERLSATSILRIFKWLGVRSSFERNGEYYCLFMDWQRVARTVDLLMLAKDEAALLECRDEEHREVVRKLWKELRDA